MEKGAGAPDFLATKVEHRAHRSIDRRAAGPAPSLNLPEPKDAVAEITKLLGDEPDLLPGLAERLEVLLNALASTEAATLDLRLRSTGSSPMSSAISGDRFATPRAAVAIPVGR